MTALPSPLEQVGRYFAAATIAHEYVADLDRELAELGQRDDLTTELVRESADVVTRQMPALTRRLRDLAGTWTERRLLDPAKADATLADIDAEFASVEPKLSALRARQDAIAAALRKRIERRRQN